MTDHPGEQFPSEVDPDVEPGYEARPEEDPEPDYDSEPGAQSTYRPSQHGVPHSDPLLAGFTMYGELPAESEEEDTEQAFEASLEVAEPELEVAEPELEVAEPVVDELPEEEPEIEPQEIVVPRPVVPSPASFQPRPPSPVQPRPPVPAPVERDEDAPHPLVEETMARLDELRDKPVGEHAEVYADLHERLQTALVEADAEDRG
ncbi:hypothetical protein [Kribbella sp. NPDC006257]|uniref:hypothetical protein n=1 Tax=Kribbella sp. NPDC006257 TaxID=3156738 RepID=UPI0033BCDC86